MERYNAFQPTTQVQIEQLGLSYSETEFIGKNERLLGALEKKCHFHDTDTTLNQQLYCKMHY